MSIPSWLTGLIDDAAIFPPGNAPLPRAVAEHREHRSSEYADLVGPFVISDLRLPDLIDVLDERDDEEPLAARVVVTGGAGAIEPAVRWATGTPLLQLAGLEVALRDEDDLARNAQRVCSVVAGLDLDDADVYVEPPRTQGLAGAAWLTALDEVAAADLRLKFRTGGAVPEDFPPPAELAGCIEAALDRELPFKCTAGLHHAVRHTDPVTGITHHGFLNVLAATRASLDGADPVEALEQADADALLDGFEEDARARTRRWFTSVGSCSVLEPHDDLVELGLL